MKKGFTLVELLAVIVILAIIAIITIPMIASVIEKSKLGAMEDSAYGLIEASNYYYAEHMDEMSSNKLFVIENGVGTSEEKLNYKGKIEGNAKVLLASNGKVALCLTNGKSYAKKEITDSKVVMNTVSSDTTCEINGLESDSDITIDISGSNSSYYNKVEIDDKLNDLKISINDTDDKLNDIRNDLIDVYNDLSSNNERIEALSNKLDSNISYSTNEIIVGTWIDGKKIYRKTIEESFSSAQKIIYISIEGMTKIISVEGFGLWSNSALFPIGNVDGVGNGISLFVNVSNNSIIIEGYVLKEQKESINSYWITVDYLKE